MDEPQFRTRPRSRRWFLWTSAGTVGAGAGVVALASGVGAAPARQAAAPATPTATAAADPTAVEPTYGAGIFDVDPSQAGVSQSASVIVTGDVAALPLDMDL
jgi:hypothetical protein